MNTRADQPTTTSTWGYSRAWRLVSVIILRPLLAALIRNKWQGKDNVPKSGGIILAPNHMSYADWATIALFSYVYAHRYPVFMIKSSVFEAKGLGPLMYKLGQLPVYRGRGDAGRVLKLAEQALRQGACVIVYPEGTATRDPGLWPMVAKTGAARLSLTTGAPVVPIAHWGAQHVLPYGSSKPRLFPRKTVQMAAGPPVDLSRYAGSRLTASTLRNATADIMADITALLAKIRQETPPAVPFDLDKMEEKPSSPITNGDSASPAPAAVAGPNVPAEAGADTAAEGKAAEDGRAGQGKAAEDGRAGQA